MIAGCTYQVSARFLLEDGLVWDSGDLAYGLARGCITAWEVLRYASGVDVDDPGDQLLSDLHHMSHAGEATVHELLMGARDGNAASSDKWLYTQLKASFLLRPVDEGAVDEVLQKIYADFDHPDVMLPLVGHTSRRVLHRRPRVEEWRAVIDREWHRLSGEPDHWTGTAEDRGTDVRG